MNSLEHGIDHRIQTGFFSLTECPQNMRHSACPTLGGIQRRGTNPNPQPRKLLGAEMLNRASKTVVPPGTPLGPEPQSPKRKIHVIHKHKQLIRFQSVPVQGCTD